MSCSNTICNGILLERQCLVRCISKVILPSGLMKVESEVVMYSCMMRYKLQWWWLGLSFPLFTRFCVSFPTAAFSRGIIFSSKLFFLVCSMFRYFSLSFKFVESFLYFYSNLAHPRTKDTPLPFMTKEL